MAVFDPRGTIEYDYWGALDAGLGPDESGHWPSVDPVSKRILKGVKHPTFALTVQGEADAGNQIVPGEDARLYSQPFNLAGAPSPAEIAAQRTRRSVRPGARMEGLATKVPVALGGIPMSMVGAAAGLLDQHRAAFEDQFPLQTVFAPQSAGRFGSLQPMLDKQASERQVTLSSDVDPRKGLGDLGAETALNVMGLPGILASSPASLASGMIRRTRDLPMDRDAVLARAKEQGWDLPWYHGGQRMDRFTEKGKVDPRRATSGPMPFFTDDPVMASSYATGKKGDTSLVDTAHVPDYFTVHPKHLGYAGSRTPYTVEQSWHHLPAEVRADILDRSKRIGYANPNEASGPLTLHPPGSKGVTLSDDHFDYTMRTEARGNPLHALREMWHDGGNLVGDETKLADIFRLAGYPHPISEATAPWTEARGVFPAALRLRNPLRTENTDLLTKDVLPSLAQEFKRDRSRVQPYGADMWDKNTRWTPRDWIAHAQEEYAKGNNPYAFTSIPDKITGALSRRGFDSILDSGGKIGGEHHNVAIPFRADQVRSIYGRFDPANEGSPFLLGANAADRKTGAAVVAANADFGSLAPTAARNVDDLGFYSHGAEMARQLPQETGTPQQMRAMLEKQGVKKEEFETAGWGSLAGEPSITRQQAADLFERNPTKLEEVRRVGESPDEEGFGRRLRELQDDYVARRGGDPDDWHDTAHAVASREQRDQAAAAASSVKPRFGDDPRLQIPGGTNYQEMQLVLPTRKAPLATVEDLKSQGYTVKTVNENDFTGQREVHIFNPQGERVSMRSGTRRTPDEALEDFALNRAGELSREAHKAANFTTGHWPDEPNTLLHTRFNDRVIDGKKTLFIEEVQSDWHQAGRRRGYNSGDPPAGKVVQQDGGTWKVEWPDGSFSGGYGSQGEAENGMRVRQALKGGGVPDAPFKKTEDWAGLAMRKMLKHAADNGYEKIAWTPGSVQADRYDLSKHISDVTLHGTGDNLRLSATDKSGRNKIIDMQHVTPQTLSDYIGKEAAEKLLAQAEPDPKNPYAARNLFNADLKVGGEGMAKFYDEMLPSAVNKMVKKHGAQVGRHPMEVGHAPGDKTSPMWQVWEGDVLRASQTTRVGAERYMEPGRRLVERPAESAPTKDVHTLDITPSLRDELKGGVRLFSGGQDRKAGAATVAANSDFGSLAPQRPEDLMKKWDARGVRNFIAEQSKAVGGHIKLHDLVVPKGERGGGVGSEFMRDLVSMADQQGKTVVLTAAKDYGATSVARLKEFYKQFGFVENKGRNKDFTISDNMYRKPRAGGFGSLAGGDQ